MKRREFLSTAAGAALLSAMPTGSSAVAQNNRYRVCVIGDTQQGGYGHSLHLIFGHRNDVEIAGLADPDEAGRVQRAAECGAQRTYADYRQMLEREQPDIVVVAPRWTINHKDYVLACAEAAAHGIVEKPLAVDLAEADAMLDAIDNRGLQWTIAFNFRVTDIVDHIKRAVFDEGLLGKVLEMRGRGKEDARSGGEDLIVLGGHLFDIMRHLAGDPEWCQAVITANGQLATPADVRDPTEPLGPVVGDTVHAAFGFADGLVGHFASVPNPERGGGRWGIDLCCSQGIVALRLNGGLPEARMLRDPRWAGLSGSAEWEPLPGDPQQKWDDPQTDRYGPIVDDLLAAIEEDRSPRVTIHDGRASEEFIHAAWTAHIHGARVAMPLREGVDPLSGKPVTRAHPLQNWDRLTG